MSVYFEAINSNGKTQIRDDTYITWLYSKTKLSKYYVGTLDYFSHFSDGTKFSTLANEFINNHKVPSLTAYQMHLYDIPEDALCFVSNPYTDVFAHVFFAIYSVTEQTGPYYYNFRHIGNKKYLGIANCTKAQANNFNMFIYSQGENNIKSNFGLECYNESGKKVFDSNKPPIKLLGCYNFKHINYSNGNDLAGGSVFNKNYLDDYVGIDKTLTYSNKNIGVFVSSDGFCGGAGRWSYRHKYNGQDAYGCPTFQTVSILSKDSVRFRTRDFHLTYSSETSQNPSYALNMLLGTKVKFNITNAAIIDVTNY